MDTYKILTIREILQKSVKDFIDCQEIYVEIEYTGNKTFKVTLQEIIQELIRDIRNANEDYDLINKLMTEGFIGYYHRSIDEVCKLFKTMKYNQRGGGSAKVKIFINNDSIVI